MPGPKIIHNKLVTLEEIHLISCVQNKTWTFYIDEENEDGTNGNKGHF